MFEGKRVLLVEDNNDDAYWVLATLKEMNIKDIDHVVTGEEALEILKTKPMPDIIFLDVQLPGGLDGLEVYDRIDELDIDAENRVVYMTDLFEKKRGHLVIFKDTYPQMAGDIKRVVSKLLASDQ